MRRALWMASGVIVWALHFTIVYGFTGVACARGMDRAVPWAVGVATLAAAAVAALVVVRGARRRDAFEDWIAAGLAAFALLAILWEGIAVFMVAPCALR
jgi:hypothetical protein